MKELKCIKTFCTLDRPIIIVPDEPDKETLFQQAFKQIILFFSLSFI